MTNNALKHESANFISLPLPHPNTSLYAASCLVSYLMTSTSSLRNHSLQLLDLSLCSKKCSQAILGEFTGAFVFVVSQQFDDAFLVWGGSADFLDERSDSLRFLRKRTSSTRRTRSNLPTTRNMSLIHADGNTYHPRYQFPIPLQQNLKIQRNFTKSTTSPCHQSIHHHNIGCGTCVCGNGLSRRQGMGKC